MSLNHREREITGVELRRHADAAGLGASERGAWLGLDEVTVARVLTMTEADPVLVWYLRDALDAAVRRRGADGGGWSVLTDAARLRAQQWFALRDVPPQP